MESIIICIFLLILILFISCVKIVSKNEVYIIERLGKYFCTWREGVHFKLPLLDRVAARYVDSTMKLVMNPFDVKTSDEEMITLKTIVILKVVDYYKYTYSQAPQQFENLIHDELNCICRNYPSHKIDESLKEIEYKVFNNVDNSPAMLNIGLKALELTIQKEKIR